MALHLLLLDQQIRTIKTRAMTDAVEILSLEMRLTNARVLKEMAIICRTTNERLTTRSMTKILMD